MYESQASQVIAELILSLNAQENPFLANSSLETAWLHSVLGWSLSVRYV